MERTADCQLLPFPGEEDIAVAELKGRRARVLATAIATFPFVSVVCCRRVSKLGAEAVIFEVEVERGQFVVHDIRSTEVVAVIFPVEDTAFPEVLALRQDFPLVPHLNLREDEYPRSLCVYEDVYAEYKLKWSPARFVEDIRTWLARTARGELHAADQPLEPLMMPPPGSIVMPDEFIMGRTSGDALFLRARIVAAGNKVTFVCDEQFLHASQANLLAIYLLGGPQEHGIIRRAPQTLAQLHTFLEYAGVDLLSALRKAVRTYLTDNNKAADTTHFVLIIDLPKKRSAHGEVESIDRWAFKTDLFVGGVGTDVGVCEHYGGHLVLALADDVTRTGDGVAVLPLRRLSTLSPALASVLNGVALVRDTMCIVGVGALGSQVLDNLLRAGFGRWTVIDDDVFFPHNAARHALAGVAGMYKAEAVTAWGRLVLRDPAVTTAVTANVLFPGEHDAELRQAIESATAVVDCSASVAVARHLARELPGGGRRVSAFLNPSATDLVVLCEPADRSVQLDQLEMAYYHAVASVPELNDHLRRPDGEVRYSNACRDLSVVVRQDLVSLNAAIASAAIRNCLERPDAFIGIWSADPGSMTTRSWVIEPPVPIQVALTGWRVLTDARTVRLLRAIRRSKLPNETGGVLLGTFDMERKLIHVVGTIPSPPDSREWPHLYIRGSEGLRSRLDEISAVTHGGLEYVGEWHSHPDGCAVSQSSDDSTALATLCNSMAADGRPALMAIVGEVELMGWYLADSSGL
jgi:hypothetical protein